LSNPAIEILYEEGPVLAVLKPAGLATQAPLGIDSLEVRARRFLSDREGKSGNIYLGLPHRLDRPVSGVLLLARHVRAARRLSKQFENRQIEKIYWACVEGAVTPPEGTWRDHLKKIYGHPRAEVVAAGDPHGREAVLHYRTAGATTWGAWLEIRLETGRTHQIRVQASSRGQPVVGDAFYGSIIPFGRQHADERLRAIALHGRSIRFQHPMTREDVTVTAPLGEDWTGVLPRA
jgi:23S rRNA pseudouridine1911/1915/1917 synthase